MSTDDFPEDSERSARNAERFVNDTARLRDSGVPYEIHGAHHFIVSVPGASAWDYWPSTGKYHERVKGSKYLASGFDAFARSAGINAGAAKPHTLFAPSAEQRLNEHVRANEPLVIMWKKHMSRFAVWSYQQAGFIVLGYPK